MTEAKPRTIIRTVEVAPLPHLEVCRDCGSKTEPRYHVGAKLDQWFCSNPDCWLSK